MPEPSCGTDGEKTLITDGEKTLITCHFVTFSEKSTKAMWLLFDGLCFTNNPNYDGTQM